jgi:nitrite reductase/ring-hydroxylating ferredoxin subunit
MSSPGVTRRVRIPGAGRLKEGQARKILVPSSEEGGAPAEIVLVRLEGRLHALDTLCPHEGGRLAEGPLREGRYISCPLHLYRFDPRSGAAIQVECEPATTYPVREVDGAAEVELPREKQAP